MSVVPISQTVAIDQEAVLKSLNLNPRDPKTQALLLVCEKYGLDPLLRHMVLISGNPYITRDGLLAVAHRSGQLDGIEVLEVGEDKEHYTARVSVYRKDMGRPFTYTGRFPKAKKNEYGPEMAIKVAEVAALRRAFAVTGVATVEEQWDVAEQATEPPAGVDTTTGEVAANPWSSYPQHVRDVLAACSTGKVPEDRAHALAEVVSGGRTTSRKTLTQPEAARFIGYVEDGTWREHTEPEVMDLRRRFRALDDDGRRQYQQWLEEEQIPKILDATPAQIEMAKAWFDGYESDEQVALNLDDDGPEAA